MPMGSSGLTFLKRQRSPGSVRVCGALGASSNSLAIRSGRKKEQDEVSIKKKREKAIYGPGSVSIESVFKFCNPGTDWSETGLDYFDTHHSHQHFLVRTVWVHCDGRWRKKGGAGAQRQLDSAADASNSASSGSPGSVQ